ncbi:hypothetical protein LguiB_012892 [Lonicera macranthoides]
MTISREKKTHVLVIPFPQPGHMLPLFNLAHELALRGLTLTILVSPKTLPLVTNLLSKHPSMQTLVLPVPPHPSLPAGVENMQELPITFVLDIISALEKLYDPVLNWIQTHPSPPVAIVSDIFHSWWTTKMCDRLGIKRIGFTPISGHPLSSWMRLTERKDALQQVLPNNLVDHFAANAHSWGLIVNSFDEMEGEYSEVFKSKLFRHDRIWNVGPLLPVKKNEVGLEPKPVHEVITWLDSCSHDKSVVYVGFGTQITLTGNQMEALASALEMSGVRFVWSIKEPMKGVQVEEDQNVVPTGFEERVAGRGIIARGWVPQVEILEHRAVGAYLTHCGWNSALEGICAGVLLLAWPMQADHFYNTRMLVDNLGAAIRVCEGLGIVPDATKLAQVLAESVNRTRPERARVMELKTKALGAIKEGGSSYRALGNVVNELLKLEFQVERQ